MVYTEEAYRRGCDLSSKQKWGSWGSQRFIFPCVHLLPSFTNLIAPLVIYLTVLSALKLLKLQKDSQFFQRDFLLYITSFMHLQTMCPVYLFSVTCWTIFKTKLKVNSTLLLVKVKLDVYLAELTKIGKSQKYTLSVDVERGQMVVMKKVKDSQEDWTTFTHDRSEKHWAYIPCTSSHLSSAAFYLTESRGILTVWWVQKYIHLKQLNRVKIR